MSWMTEFPQSRISSCRRIKHFHLVCVAPMALSAFANHLTISSMDNLSVFFLAQGEQSGDDVIARLVTFIRAAKQTLAFAIYDMRFSDPLRAQLAAALRDRAEAGLEIRFCYDADKPPSRILPLVRTQRLRARAHLCNHSVTRGGASRE